MESTSPKSTTAGLLSGRYQLGEVIGRGGMASVYSARDVNLGRDVALKLFAPQSADPDELRRQEAEILLLATLNHPSLVTLFDAGTDTRIPDEPRPFLTMELVDGQDLRARIRHSPLPLADIAVIGAGVSDALAYVHSLGIVHRDIKPANILLVPVRPGEPLRPKLTDFGIARLVDGTRLTATGTMVGTAAYLSPEQSRGAELGPASDIYSLGLVLLECIKGELEFPGSAVESAVARLHRAPAVPDSVPAEWAKLIRAMTALDPLERPPAADLEMALRHALVSPESLPGLLAEERTRVLPAPPPRPPLLSPPGPGANPGTLAMPIGDPAAATGGSASTGARAGYRLDPDAVTTPRADRGSWLSRTASRLRLAGRRTQILLSLALLALVTGAITAAVALAAPVPPAVVPYPAVTGDLGQHLQELQKSVEP
ncbi:serine/threonine-protein kinase [Arthrobacter sp. AL12]|uniref:serine/threonine-protein kinase n=1 Tax=Arthrobacter sp. AL12 TaxID=3042241 RepID=UPI00249CC88E|nr:serine/threonine-protein kinase [Arthrobacter sp. AL12]MDI3212333.1 serine/threonine-protein kinase [Arthrobacter sp. AL12]